MAEPKKSYHHGDLKAALLETAAEMISESGVEAITMRSLSQRIGVSRTAPYRHFKDKEDLLVAVAQQGFERLFSSLRELVPQNVDSRNPGRQHALTFQRMAAAYVRFAVDNPAHYNLMYGREALQREEYPQLRSAAIAAFEEMVDIIRLYQSAGQVKTDDPKAMGHIVWSTLHGVAHLLVTKQIAPTMDPEHLARLAAKVLLDGVAK